MWRKMGWPVPRRSQHQSDASHISTYGVRISWLCHVIWLYHLISIQYQLHPTAAETNPNYLRWKWMIMLLILSNWDSVGFQTCLILFIQPQSWIHSHGSWLILLGCVKTIRDMLKYDVATPAISSEITPTPWPMDRWHLPRHAFIGLGFEEWMWAAVMIHLRE